MATPSQVRSRGILIKPDEVPDTIKYGCRTRLLMSPAMGSALTGCRVIYHQPGETFTVHRHPISEVVIAVFKGRGEAFLADFWYEVREGDVVADGGVSQREVVEEGSADAVVEREIRDCGRGEI